MNTTFINCVILLAFASTGVCCERFISNECSFISSRRTITGKKVSKVDSLVEEQYYLLDGQTWKEYKQRPHCSCHNKIYPEHPSPIGIWGIARNDRSYQGSNVRRQTEDHQCSSAMHQIEIQVTVHTTQNGLRCWRSGSDEEPENQQNWPVRSESASQSEQREHGKRRDETDPSPKWFTYRTERQGS